MGLDIPAPLVSAGQAVPQVCVRHGEPATRHRKVVFRSYIPAWTYLLILIGLLPFLIVAAVLQKRVKAPAWPFCARCSRLRTIRLLAGLAVAVLSIAAVPALAPVLGDDSPYGPQIALVFVLVLIAGLGIASSAASSAIAAGYASHDGSSVKFRRPHPRFADQVAALQQQAVPQQAVPQGYGLPYAPQPYPPQPQPSLVESRPADRGW